MKKLLLVAVFGLALFVNPAIAQTPATVCGVQCQIDALKNQIIQLQAEIEALLKQQAGGYCFTRDLGFGQSGDDVRRFQQMLADRGYLKVVPTGYFGPLTRAASLAWQDKLGGHIGTGAVSAYWLNKYSGCQTPSPFPITVLSPNGGEVWAPNSVQDIRWSVFPVQLPGPPDIGPQKFDLYLDYSPAPCAYNGPYTVCPDAFPQPYVLDKNIGTNAIYHWIVATDIVNNPIPAGQYKVRACAAGTTNCDSSDAPFSITSPIVIEEEGIKKVQMTPEYLALVAQYGSGNVSVKAVDYHGQAMPFLKQVDFGFKDLVDCIIVVEAPNNQGFVYQLDDNFNTLHRVTLAAFKTGLLNVDAQTAAAFWSNLK